MHKGKRTFQAQSIACTKADGIKKYGELENNK